jgi:uncharacterized RDD family membrane protein YckC
MPHTSATPRIATLPTPLDTRQRVETPEGIDLSLRPAGLVIRSLAFAIDLLVRGVLLIGLLLLLDALGEIGLGAGALLLFLVNWWYMVLFEVLNQGRSPGKQLLKLRVVLDDGTAIGWSASMIRNLLRFVDMLPVGYCLGALWCLHEPWFRRLGDLAAGTLVVYQDRPRAQPPRLASTPLVAPFRLEQADQRAILGFAERRSTLSDARADELANLLAAPLGVASAAQAKARLDSLAQGLLGPT